MNATVSDSELAEFLTAALGEAGWPIEGLWARTEPNGSDFHFGAFDREPPRAVRFKAATLAAARFPGLEVHVCWPCYRAWDPLPRQGSCPHDWRTQPQPTREDLAPESDQLRREREG